MVVTSITNTPSMEERVARIEGELAGMNKRIDDLHMRMNDMNSRLNILTASVITQTLVTAGLVVTILLRT